MTTISYYRSLSFNPYENLAVEEFLLRNLQKGEQMLYLWQNDNTLVIGRNQNAYAECSPSFDGSIARRLSGGGAVFHDKGNLNFTFLSNREEYSLDRNLRIILRAVSSLGIEACFSGRNDLTVEGRKFSGNAFLTLKNNTLHHGTILIDSDLSRLSSALKVSGLKLQSKGIESARSRVMNLKEVSPQLTVRQVEEAFLQSFRQEYSSIPFVEKELDLNHADIRSYFQRYASKDHVWGENPCFSFSEKKRLEWGEVEIRYEAKGDRITDVVLYSDALDTERVERLRGELIGLSIEEFWRTADIVE